MKRPAGYTRCGTVGVRGGTTRLGGADAGAAGVSPGPVLASVRWLPGELWPGELTGCAVARHPEGRAIVRGDPLARLVWLFGWIGCTVHDPAFRAWARPRLPPCTEPVEARAAAVLRLVQAVPYTDDPPGPGDLVRSWPAMLAEGEDCEGLSALTAALDTLAGIGWWLLWIGQESAALDHVTLLARCGGAWCWQEPSLRAEFNEGPYRAAARLGLLGGGADGLRGAGRLR